MRCSSSALAGGGGLALVFVLGGLQRAERVVPVGLEGVRDEPVVGVDGEIPAAGELGMLAGAVDVGAAELVGVARRWVSSSAWTVSATSSASGVTVSSSSWLIA